MKTGDKNIQIQITATGGDQAAGEMRKVDAAQDSLASGSGKAGTKLEEFNSQGRKVTSSSLEMRTGLQNVGYQVQDFAVQVGSGTSALRAFSQQAPQLLSAFGPYGVLAGTVIAIGAPLAGALMAPGEAAEDSKDKIEGLAGVMDSYAEAATKATREREVEALGEWFEALDDEAEKLERNNAVLERSVELQAKLASLKKGVESAERDLAIAKIESDPNLSEADKTRQVAAYKEREERRKAEGKIDAVNAAAASSERGYNAAQGQSDELSKAAEAARAKREQLEAEQAAARERTRIAKEDLPKLEEKLKTAQDGQRAARIGAQGNVGAETEAAWRKENADLRAQIAAAREASGKDLTVEDRVKKEMSDQAAIAKAKSEEQRISNDAEKARKEAEDAYAKMVNDRAYAAQAGPMIESEYRTGQDARGVRTEAKAREQEEAARKRDQEAADRKLQEEDDARRRERTDAIAMAALGMDASEAAGGKGGNSRGAAAIKRKAEAVMANPSKQGAEDLANLVERLLDWAERQGAAADPKYRNLEQRMKTLEARQKNGRDGR